MRHNDARKWLHAVLDLLPVLLIPVFMIYSHRHTMTQQTTVNIQYKYQSNEVNSLDDLIVGNVYHIDEIDLYQSGENLTFTLNILNFSSVDTYWVNYDSEAEDMVLSNYNSGNYNYLIFEYDEEVCTIWFTNNNAKYPVVFDQYDFYFYDLDFVISDNLTDFKYYCTEIESINVYKSDFNVIESVDVYDETSSVMNVFMDNFNGAIDKYFNMGNVFNLNGVYQWFNINIFSGNAPTIIYSVWNIALYELCMDLLFLLYGLFMWFIDMCKHLMEKPFRSIK